jgi:DNA-binding GntR family transcriptional regulator
MISTTMTSLDKEESPAHRAAAFIRGAILEARFAPGQRLVESELSSLTGLGRGPVREALRLLAAEGLVAIERNKGAVVARASKAMMTEVFEVRELLAGLAARRAALRAATSPHLESIERALDEESLRNVDDSGLILMEANEHLHQLVVDAAESPVIERVLVQMQLPELRSIFFRLMSPTIWRHSREDHIGILNTILKGDGEAAEQRMRAHVRRTAALFADLPDELLR